MYEDRRGRRIEMTTEINPNIVCVNQVENGGSADTHECVFVDVSRLALEKSVDAKEWQKAIIKCLSSKANPYMSFPTEEVSCGLDSDVEKRVCVRPPCLVSACITLYVNT